MRRLLEGGARLRTGAYYRKYGGYEKNNKGALILYVYYIHKVMEAGKQCAQLASTTIDFGRLVNLHHQINNLNTYAQVTFASLEFSACSGSLTIICNIYIFT